MLSATTSVLSSSFYPINRAIHIQHTTIFRIVQFGSEFKTYIFHPARLRYGMNDVKYVSPYY